MMCHGKSNQPVWKSLCLRGQFGVQSGRIQSGAVRELGEYS